ncbi:hypothetical protein [Flexithrix dorotheae]|uniref:hypothetical protein n=1 Tax=Flexithrix dorotheae TaxID=70993 RepID=UPI00037F4294|nr:hypothetical protein [Flexithrix dorotheae]
MKEKRTILFAGDTITIVVHEALALMEVIYYGFTTLEEFKKAWETILDSDLYHKKVQKILLDQNFMHVKPEAFSWWMENWYPRASRKLSYFGNKNIAVVAAVNFVANFQTKEDVAKIKSKCPKLKVEIFGNYDNAESWLLK